jgi:hypothetical protein
MGQPSIAQLINPAPLVEQQLKARFAVQLPTLPCLTPRETIPEIPADYVGIKFTLGQALQHLRAMPDGTFQRDAWNYVLEVQVFTLRRAASAPDSPAPTPPAPDVHGPAVGQVRELIIAARYDPNFLPWHVLTTMSEMNQTESIEVEDRCDLTTIRFGGWVCVRPSAWPT